MNLQVVSKNIHITKRDLFYTDVKLFGKQEESDSVLDDIACMIGCTRTSLNVVASDKGVRESSSLPPPHLLLWRLYSAVWRGWMDGVDLQL
jgi:DNA topoisomerase VI subunit A